MTVNSRCVSPAVGPASGVLCAQKQLPPGVARYGHCARGRRTQNVFRPMDPARNPVAASKYRARSELRSRGKLLRNLREFHSTADADEHRRLRVDTYLNNPLYYGSEICRRASNFECPNRFCSREERTRGTQSARESDRAAGGIGSKFPVSEDQALLHE